MSNQDGAVVITGGTRGIGREISLKLARQGRNVAAIYKNNSDAALELEKVSSNLPGEIITFQASVSDFDEIYSCFEKIHKKFGNISAIVNNAGTTRDGYLMTMKESDWNQTIEINLIGVLNCSLVALPYLKRNNGGVIVNMASISGVIGTAGQTNYSASKAGIIGFTRSLALEVIGDGIYVYGVAPGYIETEMVEKIPKKLKDKYVESVPLKRFGATSDISDTVSMFIKGKLNYTTGQTFIVDGGLCIA